MKKINVNYIKNALTVWVGYEHLTEPNKSEYNIIVYKFIYLKDIISHENSNVNNLLHFLYVQSQRKLIHKHAL